MVVLIFKTYYGVSILFSGRYILGLVDHQHLILVAIIRISTLILQRQVFIIKFCLLHILNTEAFRLFFVFLRKF